LQMAFHRRRCHPSYPRAACVWMGHHTQAACG
jgi:hypothetical protein